MTPHIYLSAPPGRSGDPEFGGRILDRLELRREVRELRKTIADQAVKAGGRVVDEISPAYASKLPWDPSALRGLPATPGGKRRKGAGRSSRGGAVLLDDGTSSRPDFLEWTKDD